MVIDTAQGGERGGTLAGEAQTVYRRSFPCWYKQTPEAALSGGLGAAATNKHAPGIYRRIACHYILFAITFCLPLHSVCLNLCHEGFLQNLGEVDIAFQSRSIEPSG